ncbi:MAG: acyl--CoA ligase [Solobacterium sp.]|nr:acyl--CoA ligase [Solobacterium sp.]
MNTNTSHETTIHYPELTMFQMVERVKELHPNSPAYEFYDKQTTFRQLIIKIEQAARAFIAFGVRKGDVVTICMPNTPQAVVVFYALNRIGAVSNMIHPLSAVNEIASFLTFAESSMILTLDSFYEKVHQAIEKVPHKVIVLTTRIQDELPLFKKIGYIATTGRKFLKNPNRPNDLLYSDFLKKGTSNITLPKIEYNPSKHCSILYSGGTSSLPKGICLSDKNFNATALQSTYAIQQEIGVGDTMLSCMPIFHGFGLGINIHTALINGCCCVLMPSFNGKSYAEMLIKKQPNFIAGVPTIFEALLHIKELDKADLSCLKGMFCGGDSLSIELKKKVDCFLKEHNASIQIREGYGLTECVSASCLTPKDSYREGSIGLPFPDTVYCIVKPETDEEVAPMEEGEIILKGPSVMNGYLKNEEETKKTLRRLSDGDIWLYTGDLGYMDKDGYIYFKQRIKRMIVTNGYNVYPSQIENYIDSCEEVSYSCVIGVKDERRMQRVKAFIVLKDGVSPTEEVKNRIMNQLKLHVSAYALPREIEFRNELPKTLVGKVAYRVLEEQEKVNT